MVRIHTVFRWAWYECVSKSSVNLWIYCRLSNGQCTEVKREERKCKIGCSLGPFTVMTCMWAGFRFSSLTFAQCTGQWCVSAALLFLHNKCNMIYYCWVFVRSTIYLRYHCATEQEVSVDVGIWCEHGSPVVIIIPPPSFDVNISIC